MTKGVSLAKRFGGAALVTGASAGIGEAFARDLASRGMDLVLVARRKERLERLSADLSARHGIRAEAIPCDLTEPDSAERLLAACGERDISIGLLIPNAGFGSYGPFLDQDPAAEARMVDLNCRSVVSLCHAFLPSMVRRGRGGVILLASIGAYQPCPYFSTYGATKAFNLMLGEALNAELTAKGIEVLALSPGYTKSEFQEVAGSPGIGPAATPESLVRHALTTLGKRPSTVHGFANYLMVNSGRFLPRRLVAWFAGFVADPRRHGNPAARH